ncbi:MAG TPA: cyclase family protein [Gammaproteobacteria bacterium]|nr:cyclase family protein [Gammaproteobacteria bacterium]
MKKTLLWLIALLPFGLAAQNRQAGPWWPSAEWGPMDQAGASNRITPEKIVAAFRLVQTGRVYELGQVYERGMPLGGTRDFALRLVPAIEPTGPNRVLYNDEFLAAEVGQVGTQFDGLGHIGGEIRYADGSLHRVFYNGYTTDEMNAGTGLRELGIEHIKPLLTRGVLVDLPAYKNLQRLAGGYEVTLADVRGALQRQGIAESSIMPGDAVLFRYGWAQLWSSPTEFMAAQLPGIGLEVARWLVERKVTVTGSDTSVTEVSPNPTGQTIPVHQELMMKNGIFNIENMTFEELAADRAYEFLFVATPIRFEGATGSPLRPLAIR